jgi:hypothetical protein
MYHRPLTIAGCVTGVLALLLLAWLVMYPVRTDAPMTARIAVLATADILLGRACPRLPGPHPGARRPGLRRQRHPATDANRRRDRRGRPTHQPSSDQQLT